MMQGQRYYGKFRGTVINNVDPQQRGRLLVSVPDVLTQIPSSWAEPCLPLAGPSGPGMGSFFLPPVDTGVWVEFEYGDPDRPIWVGCRWTETSSVPDMALEGLPSSPSVVIQTLGQNAIVISDVPGPDGGIILQSAAGVSLIVNDTGIYLSCGAASVILSNAAGTVDVNDGALTVTSE
jgi:uncharacterized protein involved in type VI secretion and phage assembly